MTGDQSRSGLGPRSTSVRIVNRVTTSTTGAAMPGTPCGISVSMSNTMGITVAAMSMITVPVTTGVKTRRSAGSQAASRNWTREETTIRLAITCRAGLHQRRDADRDEGAGGAHHQDVTGAEPPEPDGLQDGVCATDEQSGEYAPGYVIGWLVRDAEDDHHREDDAADHDQRALESGADQQ